MQLTLLKIFWRVFHLVIGFKSKTETSLLLVVAEGSFIVKRSNSAFHKKFLEPKDTKHFRWSRGWVSQCLRWHVTWSSVTPVFRYNLSFFPLLFIPHIHVDISNLRSGPILAVLIHSLLRSRAALPAGMLFTKRNENRAWCQVRI